MHAHVAAAGLLFMSSQSAAADLSTQFEIKNSEFIFGFYSL